MKPLFFLALLLPFGLFAQQQLDYSKAPNSYIFDPIVAKANAFSGVYIPVKKAYSMWAGYEYLKQNENFTPIPFGEQSASVFWEDVPGLIKSVSIVPGSSAADSKIKVEINKYLGNGNAVITFKVNGLVYWSWHIWVTENPSNGVSYSQGFETDYQNSPIQIQYMDRNLGASSKSFLGDNWHKSGGLLYEWGRKDPFPPLVYKDFYFYEIKSELGYLQHDELMANLIPVVERPFNDIKSNIRYSVQHPLNYIIHKDNANWFSNQLHKIPGVGTTFEAWDLWGDNFKGKNSNASSSNASISSDSKSYELKSELDPCPNGWRVPSYYGRVTVNNNLGPFGRKNSGGNDDATLSLNTIYPNSDNPAFSGVKVYPSLGMDFTNAQDGSRNIGVMPISGNYEKYPNSVLPNAPFGIMYQDENSDGALWSSTYGYDGGRIFGMISDVLTALTPVGKHQVHVNQTSSTQTGNAIKCMKDPNLSLIGDFVTEYFSESENVMEEGLQNPNTYLITNQNFVEIPINKPFAVHTQLLGDANLPEHNNLKAKVLWATNVNTVKSVKIINANNLNNGFIKVEINPEQKGNFVISLHNNSTTSPAYWSWYFWVPETDPTINSQKYITEKPIAANGNFINPTKSYSPPLTTVFMDRNLGAMLPFTANSNADFLRKTKGLLFQWGRKDAIPSFQHNAQNTIYLGDDNLSENATITYKTLTAANYQNNFTQKFENYNAKAISDKYKNAEANIKYSIANPLTFLYQTGIGKVFDGGVKSNNNLQLLKDWISEKRSVMNERWGHGAGKSPFDPCPAGWRVPDVFGTILYSGSKGSSPFYNGYNNDWTGKPGVIQDQWADVVQYYNGSSAIEGWVFNDQKYPLGKFSADGIRGELGENQYSTERSGVWTASLSDLQTGFGLAMLFEGQKMQSGTGVYPQAAMSVRCAKDEPRYLGIPVTENNEAGGATLDVVVGAEKKQIYLYPNPFLDELYVNDKNAESYQMFDMSGKLVEEDVVKDKIIQTKNLVKGGYIIKLMMKDGTVVTQKMLRK